MSVARRKGDAGKADTLFSLIVRSRGVCERCGESRYETLTTAHIVRRSWSATRCLEENAWCLCWSCHRATEDDPAEFMALVNRTLGLHAYQALREKANGGPKTSSALFWRSEAARLTDRAAELGIDTRRKRSA